MGLFIEGGSRVPDWEVRAEQAKIAVASEWEAMQMAQVFNQVQQVWGGGEVLPPENSVVEIAQPTTLLVGVHGSEMHQRLVIRDPQDGKPRSEFALFLRYTPSQSQSPFTVWMEDLERCPDDDYALRAGAMDKVIHAEGLPMDYTRELHYQPSGRDRIRQQLAAHVTMALRVRSERGILPHAGVPAGARRIA